MREFTAEEIAGDDQKEYTVDELMQHVQSQERPWYAFDLENVPNAMLQTIGGAAETFDKYTGAPIRKAVTEFATGKELSEAPSGKEQAMMMGLSAEPYLPEIGGGLSPAGVAGFGLEMVQDPFLIGSGIKKAASAGLDALSGGAKAARPVSVIDDAAKSAQQMAMQGDAKSVTNIDLKGGESSIEQSGQMFGIKKPESLEELRGWQVPEGQSVDIGRARLRQIETVIPELKTKPLNYHYAMLENPKKIKELKNKFESLPTEDAQQIASYNQVMVNESRDLTKKTIDDIAGGEPKSLSDAGNDFISTTKEAYEAEKQALAPIFDRYKELDVPISKEGADSIVNDLAQKTGLGKVIAVDEQGKFILKKNTPRTGLSDKEYSALSSIVDDLSGPISFKEIQKQREYLRKMIDPANPAATAEIGKIRSVLLDKLEEMAGGVDPQMRDTFKKYAINERSREQIEKIIGGKIESLDAMFAANPDKVVSKILSNPNYVGIVKQYLGEDAVNKLLQSYVNNGLEKAFETTGAFKPHLVKTFLEKNKQVLRHLPADTLDRLEMLADYGWQARRFLDEVNPSGTAASMASILEPKDFITKIKNQGIKGAISNEIAAKFSAATTGAEASKALDDALRGVAPELQPSLLEKLKVAMPKLVPQIEDYMLMKGLSTAVKPEKKKEAKPVNPDLSMNILDKVKGSPYEQVLRNSASKGPQSLAAANYVLKSRDPRYRGLFDEQS